MAQGAPTTAHGAFRVAFTSSANTQTDTLFVAVESSADGTNANGCTNTTFVGMVGVSGEEYLSGIVTADTDQQGTVGAGTVWMQPYIRLRVRADGNTASTFLGARASILYLKRTQ